ncbi:FecR domain-containing protein [Sphingomonas sp. LB-2]|uniref:FecR family protein n=1 Tax=Sphingomonas caeni TaxID=2984949 RepID=UPI0022300AB5|nr:FecR domain-containing protein [Sphingomonas caeni]MCW3847204.1 FecR domain-containing protein [Sphingomonas caeni]
MGRFWLFAVALIFAAAGAIAVLLLQNVQVTSQAKDLSIGTTIAVDPAATIAHQKGVASVARLTESIYLGDVLETGTDGAIRIQLADATFFSLGASASARVDSFVYDPGRNSSSLSVAFQRGAFRFVSGRALHPDPQKPVVNTPVAAIGMRGTGINGVIGPEAEALFRRIDASFVPDGGDATSATLILLTDGAIDVDGSGQRITLDVPGQALFFRRKGAPPIGPVMVWTALRTEIAGLASPPGLGGEPLPPARSRMMVPPPEASPTPLQVAPTPTPSPSPSAKPSPRPSVSPSPRPTPTAKPMPTPSPKATPRPTPRPTLTPRPMPSPRFTPKPTPTPSPRFTPRPTPTPRVTPRPTPTPRFTPRPTPIPRFTPRPTPTPRPTLTPRPTRVPLTNVPRPTPTPVKR